jgi:hypothetical protein
MDHVITLGFLRNDGKRETTRLYHHTLAKARTLAESVLHKSRGLYTEVDICTEEGHVQTLQKLNPTLADLRNI